MAGRSTPGKCERESGLKRQAPPMAGVGLKRVGTIELGITCCTEPRVCQATGPRTRNLLLHATTNKCEHRRHPHSRHFEFKNCSILFGSSPAGSGPRCFPYLTLARLISYARQEAVEATPNTGNTSVSQYC